MAKKSCQNPPKPKEFHSIPFDKLKGIVVPETAAEPLKLPIVRKSAEPVDSGMDLFLEAVADVKPIHKKSEKAAGHESQPTRPKTTKTTAKISVPEDTTNALFMQEISRLKLDSKFADSVSDDGELQALSGNRLRQVKRGIVSVEYQLDLHGLRREEALAALPAFLKSAGKKGQKAVLIITGKGNHSAEEPVLQQAVSSWLREAGRELVLEFAPAPRELGGSGAFVVFLRQQSASG
jgi:DNA-nicking Smr family endonuclease